MQTVGVDTGSMRLVGRAAAQGVGAERAVSFIEELRGVVEDDLADVERWVNQTIVADSLPARAGKDLLGRGGKRLRPALALISFRAAGGQGNAPSALVHFAGAVEMLHTASLLHDDVIDDAQTRRRAPSARVTWGNGVSVIGGDLLLVQALGEVAALGVPVLDELTRNTLRELVDGEVAQLAGRGHLGTCAQDALRIAERKTASLFVLAAVGGAVLAGASDVTRGALRTFARSVGLAFQLSDDLLDLRGQPDTVGKSVAQDISTGCVTLPISELTDADRTLRAEIAHQVAERQGQPVPTWMGERLRKASEGFAFPVTTGLIDTFVKQALGALTTLTPGPETRLLAHLTNVMAYRDS